MRARVSRWSAYYRSLLSLKGRISRLGYWRANLALIALTAGVLIIGYSAIITAGPIGAILLAPMLLIPLAQLCVVVRRLHDRGKSGFWLLLFWLFPLLAGGAVREASSANDLNTALLLFYILGLIIGLWGSIEIGFRRGVKGPNRFGGDPNGDGLDVFA